MAGSPANVKQSDIYGQCSPLTQRGPSTASALRQLEWRPIWHRGDACRELRSHSCLPISKRAIRKKSVEHHRPHSRRLRSRKHNSAHCRVSEGVGSINVSCQNDQDSRETGLGFVSSIKACTLEKDVHKGIEIHKAVSRSGLLKRNIFVGTALVNFYAKCGLLSKAQEVFDELPVRNEVSWTALLAGYAQLGHIKDVFDCFEQMRRDGIHPNEVTYSSILKACAIAQDLDKGQEIHAHTLRDNLIVSHIVVGNALVDMYAKCGALRKAQAVFDGLQFRDVISWNALITGYTQCSCAKEALNCFDQMQREGLSPNVVTFISILKACGSIHACERGEAIHALITKDHLLEIHIELANALVDMYAKCGLFERAHEVLNHVSVRNVVMWTALITGYIQQGFYKEALNCFERMQSEGFFPDAFTFACILKACAHMKALNKGQEVHAQILRMQLLEKDEVLSNALLDMYAKCGALGKAEKIFEELIGQGVFLWNALITAYAYHDLVDETWIVLAQMQDYGCPLDEVTFSGVLKACGNSGAIQKGERIHAEILRHGLHESSNVVCVALLNMYAHCGMIDKAQQLFNGLQVRDSVAWGALLVGYAQLGECQNLLNLFDNMMAKGIEPEPVILTIVLNACGQVGLLSEGQLHFEWVFHTFNIIPTIEHYTCMVSLFGSAGHFDKSLAVIEAMPFPADLTIWHNLLVICQKLRSVKLARWAFEHAIQLNKEDAAAYVFTSNLFAEIGKHGIAHKNENVAQSLKA